MIKLAFLLEGRRPSPGVLGGVAEEWLDRLLLENERQHGLAPTVYNVWEEQAQREASRFPSARFVMIQRWLAMVPLWQRLGKTLGKWGLAVDVDRRYRTRVLRSLAVEAWDAVVVLGKPLMGEDLAKALDVPVVWIPFGEGSDSAAWPREIWAYGAGQGALCLPISVDLDRFDGAQYEKDRASLRERWSVSPEDVVFVCMGGTEANLQTVLDAFEGLDMPQTRLILANVQQRDDVARAWLRQPRETAKRVAFMGSLSPKSVPLCYAAADVVLVPGNPPQAAWEAMAAGRPVIQLDGEAIPGCLTLEEGKESGLVEAMALLHGEGKQRQDWAAAGLAQAQGAHPARCYGAFVENLARLCDHAPFQVPKAPHGPRKILGEAEYKRSPRRNRHRS